MPELVKGKASCHITLLQIIYKWRSLPKEDLLCVQLHVASYLERGHAPAPAHESKPDDDDDFTFCYHRKCGLSGQEFIKGLSE